MPIVGIILVGLILCFGFVLLFGAPYLPVLRQQTAAALDLLDLQPGQTLLELGCGDGRMLLAAAERGWKVVGYELNPLLVLICLWRTRRYRKLVRVRWGNFWHGSWPEADGIFVFLLQKYMPKLDAAVAALPHKPVKLASVAFQIPGKRAQRERDGVYLYIYR